MSEATHSPEQAPQRDRRGAFALLFICLSVIGAGNTMLFAAVIPPLTRELGLDDWMAGAIASLSAVLWVVMSPFWGAKSNEWGRKSVISLGLAGYGVSMLLIGIFGTMARAGLIVAPLAIFFSLLLSRSLFGLIGSGASPASQAYVADRTDPARRTEEIASVTAGFSLGTIAGPAFAAAVGAVFGLLAPVFLTAILAAAASALIWFKLPEDTRPKRDPGAPSRRLLNPLWLDKRITPYLLYAMTLSLAVGITFQTYAFAIMDKLNVTGTDVNNYAGPAYSMGAAATLIAQLVIIPRANLTNRQLMVIGAVLFSIGAALIVPTEQFAVLIMAQFMIGLGGGLCRPGFFAGSSLAVGAHEQGDVAGVMMGANAIGFVISPFFGGYLYQEAGKMIPFLISSGLMAAMAIYAWCAVPRGLQPLPYSPPDDT